MNDLFNPKVTAVIGASRHPEEVGYEILKNLKKNKKQAIPINPKAKTIQGLKAYSSVLQTKQKIDLAIICVPARIVPKVLEECGKKRIRNVIIISAGFIEAGNKELNNEIKKISEKHKIRIIGPNVLGIINPHQKLNASFFEGMPEKGSISLVSQSGALGVGLLDKAIKEKIGISKFISMGNMLNTSFPQIIRYLRNDPKTKTICLYIESLKNGREFMKECRKTKKPIIILKSGRSKSGVKAAKSHTGSLAGDDLVYSAAIKQCGAVRVESLTELILTAINSRKSKGNKTIIITNAGGLGVLCADACEKQGIKITSLPKRIINELNKFLPKHWPKNNPIDVIGDAPAERYEKVFQTLKKEKFYDFIICLLTPQSMSEPEKTAKALARMNKHKPCYACFVGGNKIIKAEETLEKAGINNFNDPELMARIIRLSKQNS